MPGPQLYFELLEACAQPGCPVCRIAQQSTARYLDKLFYERVNDVDLRRSLRRGLGFCNLHAWQLLEYSDALGIAIIYHDILGSVLKYLPEEATPEKRPGWLPALRKLVPHQIGERLERALQALTPKEPCPACQQHDATVDIVLVELATGIGKEELSSAMAASDGLCLPHLRLSIKRFQAAAGFERLLAISRSKLTTLHAELGEFIRKSDYRFRQEKLGSERDAGRRAIALAAGERQVKP